MSVTVKFRKVEPDLTIGDTFDIDTHGIADIPSDTTPVLIRVAYRPNKSAAPTLSTFKQNTWGNIKNNVYAFQPRLAGFYTVILIALVVSGGGVQTLTFRGPRSIRVLPKTSL